MTNIPSFSSVSLRAQVTCPHCWLYFPPEDVLWVAAHPDLRGDELLPEQQRRFLPSRFNPNGHAIDVKGAVCEQLACPHCHLTVPRSCLEMDPLFISIIGAPFSGKSYYLSSMTWRLATTLRKRFSVAFGSADPSANQILNEYEERLFHNPQEDVPVALNKTEKEGELYESVKLGDRVVWYPKPFVFYVRPDEGHPAYERRSPLARALCLYDNAGEHFLPGGESPTHPCKHLALSRVLFFLFDPTQHPKFRKACLQISGDPQFRQQQFVHQQHNVLLEAANRIRNNRIPRLAANEKYNHPLIMIVTKFDAWAPLMKPKRLDIDTVIREVKTNLSALDETYLRQISEQTRALLSEHAEEVVSAAEGFFREVIYIPVSALGCSPEVHPETLTLVVRPRDISPIWAEIPMLYALHLSTPRLIPVGRRASPAVNTGQTGTTGDGPRLGAGPQLKANVLTPLKETGS